MRIASTAWAVAIVLLASSAAAARADSGISLFGRTYFGTYAVADTWWAALRAAPVLISLTLSKLPGMRVPERVLVNRPRGSSEPGQLLTCW